MAMPGRAQRARRAQAAGHHHVARRLPRRRADGRAPTSSRTRSTRPSTTSSSESLEGHRRHRHAEGPSRSRTTREPPAFPASLLDARRAASTASTRPRAAIFSLGRFVDEEGDPIGTSSRPTSSRRTSPKRFESLTYVEGPPPRTPPRPRSTRQTADRGKLEVGDTLGIAGEEAVEALQDRRPRPSSATPRSAAPSIAQLTLPEAQRITDKKGKFDQISIAAADGRRPGELRAAGRDSVLPHVRAGRDRRRRTPSASRTTSTSDLELPEDRRCSCSRGVALFVGALPDLQHLLDHRRPADPRVRDAAHARRLAPPGPDLGDARGACSSALIGSVLGLLGGHRLRAGDQRAVQVVRHRPAEHRHGGRDAHGDRRAAASGMVVTLLSALVAGPARHARVRRWRRCARPSCRSAPRAAASSRRSAVPARGRRPGVRCCIGLFGGIESARASAASLIGGGAVGDALRRRRSSARGWCGRSPRVAGRPLERLRGLTGRLARENAMRKPGRTAATAAALMIGLALVRLRDRLRRRAQRARSTTRSTTTSRAT